MSTAITLFNYVGSEVRTIVDQEGEPWFVAKDVCAILSIKNPSDSLSRLDNDEKNTVVLTEGKRGNPNTSIISESGMYALVLNSRKPEAKPFRKWVTSEVLPSIRKHGLYATQDFTEMALADPQHMINILTKLKEEREQRALAEAERDKAIHTKAEIGSRREATAMATASAKSRKCKKLEDKLGEGENYKQVKAITWLADYFLLTKGAYSATGKYLTKISKDVGCKTIKVPHTEYGSVKGYHVDAIMRLKECLDSDLGLLKKYRR